jgi:hypothetical protein
MKLVHFMLQHFEEVCSVGEAVQVGAHENQNPPAVNELVPDLSQRILE